MEQEILFPLSFLLSSKTQLTTPYLAAELDRSKTNNVHERPGPGGVQHRTEGTDELLDWGGKENSEEAESRGCRRDASSRAENAFGHTVYPKTKSKSQEWISVKAKETKGSSGESLPWECTGGRTDLLEAEKTEHCPFQL